MTEVSLVPPRVDLRLYPGNVGQVTYAFDTLPEGTEWTATLHQHAAPDLDLDVSIDGSNVVVALPDPADLVRPVRMTLALDGEALIIGRVFVVHEPPPEPLSTSARVTAGAATVTVAVASVVSVGGGGGSGAVDSVNGRTGTVTGLAEQSALTSEATTRANADAALDGRLDTLEAVDYATQAELDAHATDTTSVHGVADTTALVVTTDPRLSDQRTPSAHAASHQDGGSDELALDGSQITTGTVPDARIASTIARDSEVTTAVAAEATARDGAIATHAAATDPHGDRAYTDGRITALTTVVGTKETPAGAQAKVDTHAAAATAHADTQVSVNPSGLVVIQGSDTNVHAALARLDAGIVAKVSDTAYNATSWDGVTTVAPSKNAVRDKIEALDAAKQNAGTSVPLAGGTMTGELVVPDLNVSGITGAVNPTRLVGATVSGAPVSGTFALDDVIVDQAGRMYVCTVAGTPGSWVQVAGGGAYLTSVEVTTDQTVASGGGSPDITGATVTYTFDGQPVEIKMEANPYNATAGCSVNFSLLEDGVAIRVCTVTSGVASAVCTVNRSVRRTPSAGSHTYKLQFNSIGASGTAHTNGTATMPIGIYIRKA